MITVNRAERVTVMWWASCSMLARVWHCWELIDSWRLHQHTAVLVLLQSPLVTAGLVLVRSTSQYSAVQLLYSLSLLRRCHKHIMSFTRFMPAFSFTHRRRYLHYTTSAEVRCSVNDFWQISPIAWSLRFILNFISQWSITFTSLWDYN